MSSSKSNTSVCEQSLIHPRKLYRGKRRVFPFDTKKHLRTLSYFTIISVLAVRYLVKHVTFFFSPFTATSWNVPSIISPGIMNGKKSQSTIVILRVWREAGRGRLCFCVVRVSFCFSNRFFALLNYFQLISYRAKNSVLYLSWISQPSICIRFASKYKLLRYVKL